MNCIVNVNELYIYLYKPATARALFLLIFWKLKTLWLETGVWLSTATYSVYIVKN